MGKIAMTKEGQSFDCQYHERFGQADVNMYMLCVIVG